MILAALNGSPSLNARCIGWYRIGTELVQNYLELLAGRCVVQSNPRPRTLDAPEVHSGESG